MPHTLVNGVRLYYEERGSGQTILGIHGAGSSAVFWEDPAERLSELGRVITYDRRGSWRSERPDPYETTSVQEQADDAMELLRTLAAEPAVLIGRSYGGTVALDLALRHPECMLGVALLEAGSSGLSPEYDEWFSSLSALIEQVDREQGVGAVGETVVREVFGAWEELPRPFRDVFAANGPALLAEVRGSEHVAYDCLDDVEVPTPVVTAKSSPEPLRRGSEALARALPHARSAHVAGDHAIDPSGPEVVDFVASILRTTRA